MPKVSPEMIERLKAMLSEEDLRDISEENAEDPIEKEDMARGLEPLRALSRPFLSDNEKARRDEIRVRELKAAKERAKSKAFAPFDKK